MLASTSLDHCTPVALANEAPASGSGDRLDVPPLGGALFDLYGTIVDIEVDEDSPRLWEGLAAALRETGAAAEPSTVRRLFRTFLREEGDRGHEGFMMEPVFRRLLRALQSRDDIRRIGRLFRDLSLTQLHLRPYVTPLFERLHRTGVKIGIVSNTEALLTQFELDRYPVLQTADAVVLSSQVGVRKPDPHIFELALGRIGTSRAATVFIGNDWTADVLGAQRIGMRAIYLTDRVGAGGHITSRVPGVIEAAPTIEAIGRALREGGWQE